jgi:hypothetical protein
VLTCPAVAHRTFTLFAVPAAAVTTGNAYAIHAVFAAVFSAFRALADWEVLTAVLVDVGLAWHVVSDPH